jgi:RNA polymerase sigma-70 factor, ECF subfamily
MLEPITQIRSSVEVSAMQVRRVVAAGVEPEALPDLLLVERSRSADTRAIEALIRRYGRRLFRIARSVLPDEERAEAAVCAACLTAFSDLSRYEPAGKFAAWLARLTFIHARATNAQLGRSSAAAGAAEAGAAQVRDSATVDEMRRQLEQAIDALPEVFRTVFVLRVLEGISGVETAASLALHQTTVRTRLYRALRRLPPEVVTHVRTAPALFPLSPECAERIVRRVLSAVPQGSILTISASAP